MKLFVYGTLKRAYWNHARFISTARFVSTATTVEHYAMVNVGCPVIFPSSVHCAPVAGELFDWSPTDEELTRLDQLERGYDRVLAPVRLPDGRSVDAHYYVGRHEYPLMRLMRLMRLTGGVYEWSSPHAR